MPRVDCPAGSARIQADYLEEPRAGRRAKSMHVQTSGSQLVFCAETAGCCVKCNQQQIVS